MKKIAALNSRLLYNPVKGTFSRANGKLAVVRNKRGVPVVRAGYHEFNARSALWFCMTGHYPRQGEIECVDGDPFNLRFANFRQRVPKEKRPAPPRSTGTLYIRKLRHAIRKYGLTLEAYGQLLEEQNGRCVICRDLPGERRLAVDHCHKTGKVRGLLCRACNSGLGHFKDSTALLRDAITYLATSEG